VIIALTLTKLDCQGQMKFGAGFSLDMYSKSFVVDPNQFTQLHINAPINFSGLVSVQVPLRNRFYIPFDFAVSEMSTILDIDNSYFLWYKAQYVTARLGIGIPIFKKSKLDFFISPTIGIGFPITEANTNFEDGTYKNPEILGYLDIEFPFQFSVLKQKKFRKYIIFKPFVSSYPKPLTYSSSELKFSFRYGLRLAFMVDRYKRNNYR
jgi:hypothetical protein